MLNHFLQPHKTYGKSILILALCLLVLVVLKPDRLRSFFEETGKAPCIENALESWEKIAKKAGLFIFSQRQHDIVEFIRAPFATTCLKIDRISASFASSQTTEGAEAKKATMLLAENKKEKEQLEQADDKEAALDEKNSLAQKAIENREQNVQDESTPAEKDTFIFTDIAKLHTPFSPCGMDQPFSFYVGEDIKTAEPEKKSSHTKILLTGDSMMMEGLGPALLRDLKQRSDMTVRREAVYSTGLCRKDYFDWPQHMAKIVKEFQPDIVVVCIGGNDAQDIVDDNKKRHFVGSESWQEEYKARAELLALAAQETGAKLIWVGLPILGKEPQATNTKLLTAKQKAVCEEGEDRIFVDTYSTLADKKGAYTTFIQDANKKHVRIRSKDKVHVSEVGGRLLAKEVLPVIGKLFPVPDNTTETKEAHQKNRNATLQ